MILCDFNMVAILNVTSHIKFNPDDELNLDLIRNIVLNTLRSLNRQFRDKYGALVLCCDSRSYWRKDVFPYYKQGRKKSRAKSPLDWKTIFDSLDQVRAEFAANMPYAVVEVAGAEADDIIATLTKRFSATEDILILSSDKDFVQLQKYPNVKQYNPLFKRFVSVTDPEAFTKEHILRGDYNDGIPNFLSSDNVFAIGERQKSINTVKLNEWMKQEPSEFCTTHMLRGYHRNRTLIDFDCIPEAIETSINTTYDGSKKKTKMSMMNYFMDKDLSEFMLVMDQF